MSYKIKDLLKLEVAPALGCTEPTAIALASAAAASLIKDKNSIEKIDITVDPNIYKNGLAVSIPGAKGNSGLDLAAALGAFGGDPTLKLEVLNPIDDDILNIAKKFVNDKKVTVSLYDKVGKIHIHTRIETNNNEIAEAIIEELHDNIVSMKLNGEEVKNELITERKADNKDSSPLSELEEWLKERELEELIKLLDELDDEDYQFLKEGVEYNLKLSEYGLIHGPGLGVGSTLERLVKERLLKKDMVLHAKIITSAAADARMSGVKLPAMSSAGSGNHGLTAILPIWAVKDYINCNSEKTVLKSIALSHVITAYIKAFTGRLSAVCGCSIAAGAGATAGITYLMGGNLKHIANAIKNLIEDLAGVICDGAKASCAFKLSTAAGSAVNSALFALHGIDVKSTDGIIGKTPEQTMKNVGRLSTQGMIETDRTILDIMIKKHFEEI